MEEKTKLEKEIQELEKKLGNDHFGGLLNKAQHNKDMNRLKKLKKELEKFQGRKAKAK
jgi:valyl-tRNA synthetase